MSQSVTLGGDRLGSGKKNKVHLHGYERSTHDLGYVWRSTMAAGTLVPFLVEPALPGDTFDINLTADVLTHPTIGPLFGSYKLQLDVFQIPIRLYNAKLHMNMLGIGMNMSSIKLPQLLCTGKPYDLTKPLDNQHVNPSCILSYLGIRGFGQNTVDPETSQIIRPFNAVPFLAYWDIYKQYYSNKMEEVGYVIHRDATATDIVITAAEMGGETLIINPVEPFTPTDIVVEAGTTLTITATGITSNFDPGTIRMPTNITAGYVWYRITDIFTSVEVYPEVGQIQCSGPIGGWGLTWQVAGVYQDTSEINNLDTEPVLTQFPLANIDNMRKAILESVASAFSFDIDKNREAPYGLVFDQTEEVDVTQRRYSKLYNQEGLGIKTYNSDLFNNWLNTELIDGVDGVTEITSIDTSGGSFTIDELNMAKKVYNLLNRIAVSDGSYDAWQRATYDHDRIAAAENPMYMGGLIKNVIFQEVVSNSEAGDQPLGTLAGRGKMGPTNKGGSVTVKVDEPSYIMGIVSLTPNIDYSQGNKWDTNLKTMDDFHKPALDEIGFQDLVTDQMAHWDTKMTLGEVVYKSAGKQPAWINYMTNVDTVRGNFADVNQQMFMVLNRRYQAAVDIDGLTSIKDLTTYVDPVKCNYIFADTRRDAQNFWTQIGIDMIARRKMSAKVMPNL